MCFLHYSIGGYRICDLLCFFPRSKLFCFFFKLIDHGLGTLLHMIERKAKREREIDFYEYKCAETICVLFFVYECCLV